MKKIESGRSMIEMLGVLAIIGVLSIGGLAGYTMAMNRHRANTVLDYVTKVGITAGTNNIAYTAASSTDCSTIFDGVPSTLSSCKVTKATADGDVVVTIAYNASSTSVQDVVKERIVSNKIGDIAVNAAGTEFTFTM